MRNKWRTAFLILSGIVAVIIIAIVMTLAKWTDGGQSAAVPHDTPKVTAPIFMVNANKEKLTAMINHEIQVNQSGNLSYHVDLSKNVSLTGALKILGLAIPFHLSFDPIVKDGDIILKEKAVQLGDITLPKQDVLNFIKKGTQFPKWVIIQPDKNQIYINVTGLDFQKNFYLKAKTIDLSNNKIEFNVYQK